MPFKARLTKGISEFKEQSQIVSDGYGGSRLYNMCSMAWCLLRYGARPIDYVRFEFYKKNNRERNRYMTIYRYFAMNRYLQKSISVVEGGISGCKTQEYREYGDFVKRDWVEAGPYTNPDEIRAFIAKHGTVIAKPNGGDQGKGVKKIAETDVKAIGQLIEDSRKTTFVVEETIVNSEEIGRINPSSLNTVRIYTINHKDGQPEILAIMLRAGRAGSHVDNWGSGGVGYNFDIETGICVDYGRDKKNRPYIFHPGSNVQMVGYKLPHFDELKALVLKMCAVHPEAKFVGWDVAITPKGFDLVEMNCPGGHDFLQAWGKPFWKKIMENL